MKKLFLFLTAVLMTVGVMAEGHMMFKGIEIDGTLYNVIKKLENQGFSKISQDKETVTFQGTFTGETVIVGIYATPITKTVSRIIVLYPNEENSWMVLSSRYNGLKERLTKKYGQPDEVIEKFEYPYSETSYPLIAIESEKATYMTRFKTDNGGVTLSIMHYQFITTVCLVYWDKVNEDKLEAEMQEDL